MPNMPATLSTWIRFAPVTLRERKIRSGISGVARRRLARNERGEQRERDGAEDQRRRRAPAVLGRGLDDRVDAEHQRAGDRARRPAVGALAAGRCPRRRSSRRGAEERRRDADRDVDEEDPVPVDGLGEHAAGEQADRAAGGGDERVDADRLGLLARLGEHRHDHPEDDGGGHRAADALHEARRDQHRLALRQAAQRARRAVNTREPGRGRCAGARSGRRAARRAAAGRRRRSGRR